MNLVANHRHEGTTNNQTRIQCVHGKLVVGSELACFERIEDVAAAHDPVAFVAIPIGFGSPNSEAMAYFVSHHKFPHGGWGDFPRILTELDMTETITTREGSGRVPSGGIAELDNDPVRASYGISGMCPDCQRDQQVGDEGSHDAILARMSSA